MDNAELLLAHKPKDLEWDMSSWEYLVSLLCQALCLNKVLPILGRLKTSPLSSSADFPIGMASMQINLARAAALLCDIKSSKKAVAAALLLLDQDASIQTIGHDDYDDGDGDHEADHHKHATGGKRSWKSGGVLKVGSGGGDESRERSLQLFREHRRAELRAEAQQIDSFLVTLTQTAANQQGSGSTNSTSSSNRVLPYLLRILSFPPTKKDSSDEKNIDESKAIVGTETTVQGKAKGKGKGKLSLKKKKLSASTSLSCEWVVNEDSAADNADASAIVRTTTQRFGLARFLQRSQGTTIDEANTQASSLLRQIFAEESGLLQMTVGQSSGKDEKKTVPSLKMEICSGAGEWVVAQVRVLTPRVLIFSTCTYTYFMYPVSITVGRCRSFERVAGVRTAT